MCLLVSSQLAQQKLLCRQWGERKQQRFSFPRFILWTAGLLFLVPLNRKMSCPWSFWFPFGQSSHGTSWFILWAGPRRKIREQNRVGICPTLFVLNIYFPPLHTLVKKKMEKDCQPLIFHFHSSPVPPWGYPWVKCGGEGEWGTHPLTSILHDLMLFMVSLPWFRSRVLRQCCVCRFSHCAIWERTAVAAFLQAGQHRRPPYNIFFFIAMPLADIFLFLSPFSQRYNKNKLIDTIHNQMLACKIFPFLK